MSPIDPAKVGAKTVQALAGVALLKPLCVGQLLSAIDFNKLSASVKTSEGGAQQEQLATTLQEIATLETLAPGANEATEQAELKALCATRQQAFAATKGASFQELFAAVCQYEMFTHKLLPETWDLLRRARVARRAWQRPSHYSSTPPMGLALMNILADCCAGSTYARITDRREAYASLAGMFMDEPEHIEEVGGLFADQRDSQNREVLFPIATSMIDVEALPLSRLVQLRRQEAKSAGFALRDLRHRFADRLELQVKALSETESARSREEVKRQFGEEMADDYAALRDALKLEAKQIFGMKEIISTALVPLLHLGTHMLGLPGMQPAADMSAAAVAVGGLYSAKSKFAQTRRKILREHPTAYLYEAGKSLRL